MAIALILGFHLLVAVLYSMVIPLGEAPDEVDHYAYVRHLLVERSLPVGPSVTQGKHPPLYYLMVAGAAGKIEPGFEFIRANPDFALDSAAGSPNLLIHTSLEQFPYRDGPLVMHVARLLSAILSTATVWAIYWIARDLYPERPAFGLAAAGFAAFVPGFVFISGAVNNDNLAAALSALGLALCARVVRSEATVRRCVALGLLLGLGLLAKVGTLAVWPAAAFALTYAQLRSSWGRDGSSRQATADGVWQTVLRLVGRGCLTFGIALALASPWLVRNWRLYGDPLGWSLVTATVDVRTSPLGWRDLIWLLKGWFTTFWGRFGGAVHVYLPWPVYWVLGGLTLVSVAGLTRIAYRGLREGLSRRAVGRTHRKALLVMLCLTLGGAVLSVIRYSAIGLGTDQARLLFPGLSAIVVLFVAGLAGWVAPRRWAALAGGLTLAGFLFSLLAVLYVLRVYAPPEPANETVQAGMDRSSAGLFGDALALEGHVLAEPSVEPGGELGFSLFWRAETRINRDLRSEVWLVAPDGGLVASWKRSPLNGRYSTDHWPVGPTFVDTYALSLPDWIGPGDYLLLVGVREFPSEAWLDLDGMGDAPQRQIAIVRVPD